MTDIEKKFIFTVIGFLILIMIVVLSIKSSNKNKLEQQKASENNTQLEDYVTSFEKIGREYGVTGKAVVKWCKKYGLSSKRSEINKVLKEKNASYL